MHDPECIAFLQRVLPRFGMRWKGYRKVRRQVCRKITRRMTELGMDRPADYEALLENSQDERHWFDAACRITISRFFRDLGVFTTIEDDLIPSLAARHRTLRCWSAGCASGEEAYSLAILWHFRLKDHFSDHDLQILATDADERMLDRARQARYPESAIRNVPDAWRKQAFHRLDHELYELDPELRRYVTFRKHDVRDEMNVADSFHLMLCRNVAFMYYDEHIRSSVLDTLLESLEPGGYLIIGRHDVLPEKDVLRAHPRCRCTYLYQP